MFGDKIRGLDAVSCRDHARDLFHRLGGTGVFEDYLVEVTRVAVRLLLMGVEDIPGIQSVTRRYFPDVPPGYDVLDRLTALVLRIIALSLPRVQSALGKKG